MQKVRTNKQRINKWTMIGVKYCYPNSKKVFILKEIDGYKYLFECGHWCTKYVFEDLIQLTLF